MTFYTLQNDLQEHCIHQSDSGQQVSSLHYITLKVVAVIIADKCLHLSLTSCFGCFTGVNDTCVRWYCVSCWM